MLMQVARAISVLVPPYVMTISPLRSFPYSLYSACPPRFGRQTQPRQEVCPAVAVVGGPEMKRKTLLRAINICHLDREGAQKKAKRSASQERGTALSPI